MNYMETLLMNEVRKALNGLYRDGVGQFWQETTGHIQYEIDNRIFDISVKEEAGGDA